MDNTCKIGFMWLYWGHKPALLERSQKSARQFHPDLEQHVVGLESGDMLSKIRMHELSPFDLTIYLDSDTVVMGDLSYAIQKAHAFDIAMSICEYPWAGRYTDPQLKGTDIVEYNAGVVFFNKSKFTGEVFDLTAKYAKTIDSSIIAEGINMPCNDQGCFALAFDKLGPPFVLPYNYNFRPRWHKSVFTPIKIWHDNHEPWPEVNKNTGMIHVKN